MTPSIRCFLLDQYLIFCVVYGFRRSKMSGRFLQDIDFEKRNPTVHRKFRSLNFLSANCLATLRKGVWSSFFLWNFLLLHSFLQHGRNKNVHSPVMPIQGKVLPLLSSFLGSWLSLHVHAHVQCSDASVPLLCKMSSIISTETYKRPIKDMNNRRLNK